MIYAPRTQITGRDKELLCELFGHRLMLARQVMQLGYFGSLIRCNARLRRLRESRWIQHARIPSLAGTQRVHQLAPKAASMVSKMLGVDRLEVRRSAKRGRSAMQLEHCLQVTDLRIQFEQSARVAGLGAGWTAEPLCRHEYSVATAGGGWRRRILKPDGLLELYSPGGTSQLFFIEADLGNVSQKRFAAKLASYRLYAREAFQATYGQQDFGLLVATTGQRRLSHLASQARKHFERCLFTTFSEFNRSSALGHIWHRASSDELLSLPLEGLR